MKRLYTFLLSLFVLGFMASAQAPFMLTYENHAHQGDQDFLFALPGNVDVEIAQGANQVWDFSGLANTDRKLTSFMIPSSKTLKSASFSESNLVISEFGNDFYFKVTPQRMEQYGAVACGNIIIRYDEPFLKLKFPFRYGESYSGTFSGKQISPNGCESPVKGRYNVAMVGYGRLIMPNGQQVEDVLLLRTERVNIYGTLEQATITYRWYVENVRYPICVFITNIMNGVEKTIQTAYHENVPLPEKALSFDALNTVSAVFSVFPNPYKDNLNIHYKLDKECKVTIEVYDLTGKRVAILVNNKLQKEGAYTIEFKEDQQVLPSGVYYVKAKLGNASFEQKVVKSIN